MHVRAHQEKECTHKGADSQGKYTCNSRANILAHTVRLVLRGRAYLHTHLLAHLACGVHRESQITNIRGKGQAVLSMLVEAPLALQQPSMNGGSDGGSSSDGSGGGDDGGGTPARESTIISVTKFNAGGMWAGKELEVCRVAGLLEEWARMQALAAMPLRSTCAALVRPLRQRACPPAGAVAPALCAQAFAHGHLFDLPFLFSLMALGLCSACCMTCVGVVAMHGLCWHHDSCLQKLVASFADHIVLKTPLEAVSQGEHVCALGTVGLGDWARALALCS